MGKSPVGSRDDGIGVGRRFMCHVDGGRDLGFTFVDRRITSTILPLAIRHELDERGTFFEHDGEISVVYLLCSSYLDAPPITQGASPQGSLFSRIMSSQHPAGSRPSSAATVEQSIPPHCPHSARQQAPMGDSMPGVPLLHVKAGPSVEVVGVSLSSSSPYMNSEKE